MKKNDILVIVVVAIIAGAASLIISNLIFGGKKQYTLKAPEVQKIEAKFEEPDNRYFNTNSLNPTKVIIIGNDANNSPFKGQ